LLPYDVNAPVWSDGEEKRRFLALPADGTIGYRDHGAWTMPVGTVLMKEFILEGSDRALETRFLVRRDSGWEGFTYRWNDRQTEADLVGEAGSQITVLDPAAPGGARHRDFPSREQCAGCHDEIAGGVLGFHTGQLNREHDHDGVVDNQLRMMERLGLFGGPLPADPVALPRFPEPHDTKAPVAARARAYVQGNCAHCHQPGGRCDVMDLRFETPFRATDLCNEPPWYGYLEDPDDRRLVPGDPQHSILWQRVSRRGPDQMPPLATHLVDEEAVDLLSEWITGLAGCPNT
jgi:uncharacterized repeat protein (TIGR03806 family)